GGRAAVLRHGASFTIGIGTSIDRVGHHPVDGGVARPAPSDLAVGAPGGQVEPVRVEPQERLTCAAEFATLSKTRRIASRVRRSGSYSSRSPALTKPTGAATTNSPRRAFS